jgi:16S rRNA (uracil1498-N3)-methyltransferase
MGPEAHHLVHVLRAKPGTKVVLFDGAGKEAIGVVERTSRTSVELTVEVVREVSRERAIEITLGVALPKGERQRWLVEKAVELGVRRLVPLVTQRSVAMPGDSALARLRRGVIEASKQCGRNRLMEIALPQEWGEFVAGVQAELRLVAHPGGKALREVLKKSGRDANPPRSCVLAVGPEGGFTREEIAAAESANWQLVDLGPAILRVETAAVCLVAAVAVR